jgi:hypothetical protein
MKKCITCLRCSRADKERVGATAKASFFCNLGAGFLQKRVEYGYDANMSELR